MRTSTTDQYSGDKERRNWANRPGPPEKREGGIMANEEQMAARFGKTLLQYRREQEGRTDG